MKKVLCLVLAALVALALFAGCADNSATSPTPPSNASNGDSDNAPDNGSNNAPDDSSTDGGTIKVGIVNNPPSESGYREANVKDFEAVFTAANGYDVQTYYSLKNDEQLNAAKQFITDGVDYLLVSAAATDGWDSVLQSAKEAGTKVFLFDRMLNTPEDLYEAAVVSDMAKEGETAVN
ncbi:MAG: substrate-binding domain-containing protein, partial [Oscillospiraceae bacterium]|nr:substrate-binding domain-containing protein [Oscillospiraceae bacterium]